MDFMHRFITVYEICTPERKEQSRERIETGGSDVSEEQHTETRPSAGKVESVRKSDVWFNEKKHKFGVKKLKYVGYIFTEDELGPIEESIGAVLEMDHFDIAKDVLLQMKTV
ncbi:hypothetical protein Trydic_g4522 [Trypoxylus dichotomus]